eukprot:TRINITY_DN40176_c0_g4_i1.p2 TRINITY_DN40176_c0_g4~~TRINITY_DN40176_c0_g4_i1.p2  ORF type:complete len:102 (+),score=5.35 TRINITY_DN40176_c0_g4_i1:257-562(+)
MRIKEISQNAQFRNENSMQNLFNSKITKKSSPSASWTMFYQKNPFYNTTISIQSFLSFLCLKQFFGAIRQVNFFSLKKLLYSVGVDISLKNWTALSEKQMR